MKVFKVYDDEWSEIMGRQQLKEFAISQVWNCPDDFIRENLEITVEEKDLDKILKISKEILEQDCPKLSLKDAKLLLMARCFDVEEVELY